MILGGKEVQYTVDESQLSKTNPQINGVLHKEELITELRFDVSIDLLVHILPWFLCYVSLHGLTTVYCKFQGQAVAQLAKTVPDVTIFGICSKGKHETLKEAASPVDHLLERGADYVSDVKKVLATKMHQFYMP